MDYFVSRTQAAQNLISIEIPLSASEKATELHLPYWRPGRYERGVYIENICDVRATTNSGAKLKVIKTSSHHWKVEASKEDFRFQYAYYGIATDAGGSSISEDLLYINGVNLFMYQPGQIDQPCTLHLDIPEDFLVACGLPNEGNTFQATDFHQLVDAPLMASGNLQKVRIEVAGIIHNLWFHGDVELDLERKKLGDHFRKFGEAQVKLFGGFPVDEYHYLFLIHNFPAYHGVEHFNSTVIALGPGYRVMKGDMYNELLGVSCHELFHTWNVKAIRPLDMQPYDYEGANYSALHYVTEGVTTYYGDLMLLKSGVWNLDQYLLNFNNAILKRHYSNQGRNHISLEQASFDSWVNGYKAGIPNRKISFYTKGCLAAFILDYLIRASTDNARSLDTVMKEMYERFGKTGIGYRRQDYREIAEKHAGTSLGRYFKQVIADTAPLEPYLIEAADYFGMGVYPKTIANSFARDFGFLTDAGSPVLKVKQIYEGSPAADAGLRFNDELVAVGGIKAVGKDLGDLFDLFAEEDKVELTLFRENRLRTIHLKRNPEYVTPMYMLLPLENPNSDQLRNRKSWTQVN